MFFSLVRQILMVEKRYSVTEIAARLGMNYATLYARVSGRGFFSPEELRRLLHFVPDIRLADWLLADSAFIPATRIEKTDPALSISALDHAVQTADRALSLVKELSAGAVEEDFDPERRERIAAQLNEMERGIATLRLVLPYISANPTQLHKRLAAI